MILLPGRSIHPHGSDRYRYHLNGPVHMMTTRKRVGPLPTYCLAVRHSVDYSSSDHFYLDDSSRDSSSSSSSETSSDSSVDTLSNSASSRSSSDHSVPTPSSGYEDLVIFMLLGEAGLGVDFEDESSEPARSRGANLEMDVNFVRSDGIAIDPKIQADIDECIAYADALRDRGIDARVVVEAVDREEIEVGTRGPVELIVKDNPKYKRVQNVSWFLSRIYNIEPKGTRGPVEVRVNRVTHPVVADDIPEPAQEGAIEVTYKTLGDLVNRFHDHTKEIPVHRVQAIESIQRDQGHRIVATGQVARSQRRELRVHRELRQIWRFRFNDRIRISRLEDCARRTMPNTRSGASRTREEINELN
ncbi:hypothetical protein Tco_0975291 [Tanacetum coccineum]|uniref:Uncharacterized protein n=1 Tax=Tanacetum coccineum TaxID=301880 RepID=A0ABQ5EDY5_9ASTR